MAVTEGCSHSHQPQIGDYGTNLPLGSPNHDDDEYDDDKDCDKNSCGAGFFWNMLA
jgi:hypothetical protein